MAIFLSNGVVVTLNSVDLSDHVTSATINRYFEELKLQLWAIQREVCKGPRGITINYRFSKRHCNK
jgi:hypothetical protein